MDSAGLETLLYKHSGLLGISGVSGDMRELQESKAPEAAEAIDYFVYHIVKFIGAYTAVLGGLDALVFTAGIGENAAPVRAASLRQARLARRQAGRGGQFAERTAHFYRRQQSLGLCNSDQ